MSFIISKEFIYIFCALIIVFTIIFGWYFYKKFQPILNGLVNANAEIKKSPENKEIFHEKYYDFSDWMMKNKFLRNCWREFQETLLIPGEDFESEKEVIRNTHLPSVYFNQKNLLQPNLNIRFFNAIPNILTGLGIIGTFVGLTAGIYYAAPGLNSGDIEDAKKALSLLLNGASLAFVTSIAGLVSSIIFSCWEKRCFHQFNEQCQQFVSELDIRFEYFSAERLSSKSLAEFQKQSNTLDRFTNELVVSLGAIIEEKVAQPVISALNDLRSDQQSASDDTVSKIMTEFGEKIAGAAGDEMKALASTIKTMSESLELQVCALTKGQEEMQKTAENTVIGMSNALSDGSQKINSSIDEAVSALAESVERSMEDVAAKLDDASMKLANNLADGLQKFDEVIAKLSETAWQYQAMTDANKELHSEINESLEVMQKTLEDATQSSNGFRESSDIFQRYIEELNKISSQLVDSTVGVGNVLDSVGNAQEEMAEIWGKYEQRFSGIDQALEGMFSNIRAGLESYANQTDNYVLGLDEHASKVVQNLAFAVDQISESIKSLETGLNDQSSNFEHSVKQISDSAETSLKDIESKMINSLEKMNNGVR